MTVSFQATAPGKDEGTGEDEYGAVTSKLDTRKRSCNNYTKIVTVVHLLCNVYPLFTLFYFTLLVRYLKFLQTNPNGDNNYYITEGNNMTY